MILNCCHSGLLWSERQCGIVLFLQSDFATLQEEVAALKAAVSMKNGGMTKAPAHPDAVVV